MDVVVEPIVLGPNQVRRFYRGGWAISEFRGIPNEDDHAPEDWVGSATTVFGEVGTGVSLLPDGRTVSEALASDPEAYLGPRHADRFGSDPGLLVKLLHAGQRLPVHCHPDRDFARRHLDCRWGKTEGWVILGTDSSDPHVFLGFRRDVHGPELATWVNGQERSTMLEAMNRIPIRAGDAVLVPAGVPHAIGEGVFLVELQEPTDFSVLLEWDGFGIDGVREGHLSLGFDVALGCVDRSGWGPSELPRLLNHRPREDGTRPGVELLFPDQADPFFRAERLRPGNAALIPAGFSILVVTEGHGRLEPAAGGPVDLQRGTTVLVPFAAGDCRLIGTIEAVRCIPPAPDAPDAATPELR
ncbi:MAG: class I mannose-6-phosphate isomerase [Actinomycetota bacterium]